MINRILHSEKRNIYLFYLTSVGMSAWFIASNWLYFWTKFMTYGQVGLVDALGFGLALTLEIPSGAIADMIGKRKTILIGMIAGFLGVMLMTFSGNIVGITIGWMITQICYAFYSGAGEALVYDTLKDLKLEVMFDKVITKARSIESITGATATLIGGFLYYYNNQLPHFLWGMGFFFGAVASYFFIEPKIDTQKFSIKKYGSQIFTGMKELLHKDLRKYIGFFAKEQAIILPVLTLMGAYVVRLIPVMKKYVSDVMGIFILAVLMSVGFIIASLNLGWFGLIPMFLITIAGDLASPWISIVVNKRIDSKNRATTLSTIALLTKLPYVLVVITVGKMIENGALATFNIYTGVVVVAVALLSLLFFSRREIRRVEA
jgi:MFS family permease